MAGKSLTQALSTFHEGLREARRLADDANIWSALKPAPPGMTLARRHLMTELAFLKGFLAWEVFVERSFVLYMYGQRPPRGRAPTRLAFPPTLEMAKEWVLPENSHYASWEDCARVSSRARRFFRDGRPYSQAMSSNQSVLKETLKIRNAIAHKSEKAQDTFIELARNRVGNIPPGITVGSFLCSKMLHEMPATIHFDFYLQKIEDTANRIVPK